jgi:hypothetical protein
MPWAAQPIEDGHDQRSRRLVRRSDADLLRRSPSVDAFRMDEAAVEGRRCSALSFHRASHVFWSAAPCRGDCRYSTSPWLGLVRIAAPNARLLQEGLAPAPALAAWSSRGPWCRHCVLLARGRARLTKFKNILGKSSTPGCANLSPCAGVSFSFSSAAEPRT